MNPINFAIAQHYEARDAAIKELVRVINNGYDIDEQVLTTACKECGLTGDGFESERAYIIREVGKRVKQW